MKPLKKFSAVVARGRGSGKKHNFPTINLGELAKNPNLEIGVYVCLVKTGGKIFKGAMNYGPRPTFGLSEPSIEIYLLDFDGDLYGQKVEVTVYNKIRDIVKFENVERLKEQILKDVEAVSRHGGIGCFTRTPLRYVRGRKKF